MAVEPLPKSVLDLLYATNEGLLDDDVGRAVAEIKRLGITDTFSDRLVEERVRRHRVARAFEGAFRIPDLSSGDIVLGLDEQGRPLCCPLQFLNAHALTLGGSGSGKTTKSRFMALQIVPRTPAWLFDLRKREYAVLRPYLRRVGVDLIVVPARLLRLNPLQPPAGVEPIEWASLVADTLVRVLVLPTRASKLLHAAIVRSYEEFGVLRGGARYPTLFDLREGIAADTKANPSAKMAVVDSLDTVLLSIGDVFRYHVGWTTHDLARRRIVFELGGVGEQEKNLLLNVLLLGEFSSRVARGLSNVTMDLWVCCDEAARIVSTSGPPGGLADLIGLVRGTGIGLDLSVQSADIAPSILSNTAFKAIGRCGSATDYDTLCAAMGLNSAQRAWLRTNTVPGLFVGSLGEGRVREPFVFRVPPMRLTPTHVDDSEVLGDLPLLPSRAAS